MLLHGNSEIHLHHHIVSMKAAGKQILPLQVRVELSVFQSPMPYKVCVGGEGAAPLSLLISDNRYMTKQ